MKNLALILLLLAQTVEAQWNLIWSDEFDSSALNTQYWIPEIGTGTWGWGNNELQYYTSSTDNVHLDSGYLHIVAKEVQVGNSNYTSARIITEDKFDFQYGRIEARIKVPVDQGLWPAFWMLGSDFSTLGWPHCGEIDIMEHVNNETVIHGTHHYDLWGHMYEGGSVSCDASQFHIYAVEWDSQQIKWLLDGTVYYSTNIGTGSVSKEEFHTPFFILLNLAVGGNWPGAPDASTDFPATMMVDYVRVYQKPGTVGIAENDFEVNVFPNPTNDKIHINTNEEIISSVIYDVHGKLLLSRNQESILDVSKFPSGFYFLEIKSVLGNTKRLKIQIN